MKKRRRLLALLPLLALLGGCVSPETPVSASPLPQSSAEPSPVESQTGYRVTDREDALGTFGVELLKTARTEGENTLLSPLSVALALGMVVNGAQGETLRELEELFDMPSEELNTWCAKSLEDYSALGGSSETNLVNSLWCDDSFTLLDDFTARCMDSCQAQLFNRDLQDPATVQALNDWVSEATHGMIPRMLEEFPPQSVLALVNAVYFKNAFQNPFVAPIEDWEMDFHNADGTLVHPLGMSNGIREESYVAFGDGQGVVLSYDDGRLGLLLMLPNEGTALTEYLEGWNGDILRQLLDSRQTARVALKMPKFKAEWSGDLVASLRAMGIEAPFDSSLADFSALGHNEANDPLYIGQIIHKTAFEVNEKGTEASAATMANLLCGGMPPEQEEFIRLTLERPFVYAIVDLRNAAPLFIGTVETLGEL